MSQNIQTIILNTLIDKYKQTPDIFNALPELGFVVPLAQKIIAKGCTCGMGNEISFATNQLNQVVQNLNEEQVIRFRTLFNVDKLCFGIQSTNGFEVKCY